MQKAFLAGVAAAGLLIGSALASDLLVKAPPYQAPILPLPYNWLGLYVGANFGGGWSNGSLNILGRCPCLRAPNSRLGRLSGNSAW